MSGPSFVGARQFDAHHPPMPLAKRTEPPPLSNEDRKRVKSALDNHFDDDAGQYLKGMTDQILADKLNIPRFHVTKIREAAFGPIRVTQEMENVASGLTEVGKALQRLDEEARAVQASLSALAATSLALKQRQSNLSDKLKALWPAAQADG